MQAVIARAGVASRRAAEGMILAGRVTVNGSVVTELGTRAFPGDVVALDGRPLIAEERKLRLALNKPSGYLCAMADSYGRPLAAALFKPDIKERVYNVGRLDLESSGLIFFTNDGDFAAKAGHPSFGLVKEYEVEVDGVLHPDFASAFEKGLAEGGETLKAERVLVTGPRSLTVWLAEGKNREIRRALDLFRLKATVLRRVAIGPVRLGNLAEGSWRVLSDEENTALQTIFNKTRPGHERLSRRENE
ncbi:MAG: rRNA pseudouridine synthase [Spirochaetales bacterium]|nr:MAG: rRNA pseudouridine synthase [Spirochaetales bacterium]